MYVRTGGGALMRTTTQRGDGRLPPSPLSDPEAPAARRPPSSRWRHRQRRPPAAAPPPPRATRGRTHLPPCSDVSVLEKTRMSHFWDTHHTTPWSTICRVTIEIKKSLRPSISDLN